MNLPKNKTEQLRERTAIYATRRLHTKAYAFFLILMMTFMPLATNAQQCSGTTTLTTESGTFSDGSGTGNYTNDSDCSWLIQVDARRIITLDFSAFSTQSRIDIVRVYDGTSASATLLGAFSGSLSGATLPNTLMSSSKYAYVVFQQPIHYFYQ